MYKNILVVVNEHSFSEAAANYAVYLAKFCNAKLFVFSCISTKISKEVLEKIETHANRVFIASVNMGINVESVIEKGHFFDKLNEKIEKEHIDLVFSPITYNNYKDISLFESNVSVAFGLVRVVNMAKPHPSNILIPLRGNIEQIDEWSCFTAALCNSFRSKVTVLHITTIKSDLTGLEIRLKLIELHKSTPDDITKFISNLEHKGVTIKKRFAHGMVGRSITIEAATKKNDLIIMGITQRGTLKKLISGDPTAFVLRETPCNLIIFRANKR